MKSKEKILTLLPYFLQNTLITTFNALQYKVRHGGKYNVFRTFYQSVDSMSPLELDKQKHLKEEEFLQYATNNSKWYKAYAGLELKNFPILEKVDVINNLNNLKTIDEAEGLVSLTGGTTGASMKVVYTKSDMQERFAILDHFRAKHGYELGIKTAWFSGKNLITEKDLKKGVCSHYDFINKIRFYSTFHINEKNFDVYWRSLSKFQPEFIVGFPSSVYEICEIADRLGLRLEHKVKVFFPTAETVLSQHREVIGRVLGCRLVDQYASSEGAPFILECEEGSLHIHPLTGIFEVVDENMQPAIEGEVLVTSFTTKGTPLIRYRVGDRIRLSSPEKICKCGSLFPLVDKIEGRTTDFVYSPEKGRINLGNLSNATKDAKGIVCFQVIQSLENEIDIKLVVSEQYAKNEEKNFVSAIRERVGNKLKINIEYVADIPREKSGKFRIVKNNLKFN